MEALNPDAGQSQLQPEVRLQSAWRKGMGQVFPLPVLTASQGQPLGWGKTPRACHTAGSYACRSPGHANRLVSTPLPGPFSDPPLGWVGGDASTEWAAGRRDLSREAVWGF